MIQDVIDATLLEMWHVVAAWADLLHRVDWLERKKMKARGEQKVGWEEIRVVAVVIWCSSRGAVEFLVHDTTSLPLIVNNHVKNLVGRK